MQRRNGWATLLTLCSTVGLGTAAAWGWGESLSVEQLSRRSYVIYGAGANVVLLVADDGVVVVDAGNGLGPGKRLMAKIRQVTPKPIQYLILTHYHGDHVLGAAQFPPGVTLIGHARTREHMERIFLRNALPDNLENPANVIPMFEARTRTLEAEVETLRASNSPELERLLTQLADLRRRIGDMRDLEVVVPTTTLSHRITLHLGRSVVDVLHVGPGHTDGDLVVVFRDEKIAAVGDLLWTNGWVPRLDGDAGASVAHWPEVLRRIAELPVGWIVPGHGPPVGISQIETTTDRWTAYLSELVDSVTSSIRRGVPVDDAKRLLTLPRFGDMGLYGQLLPYNIEAVYRELQRVGSGGR